MREIRAQLTEQSDGLIRGYAALWDTWSKPISERGRTFRERLARGSLVPDGSVSLWWMHDHTDPLANEKSGTLTITPDEKGIAFVADLGSTQRATEIRDLVRRGVVSEMSIGFVVEKDTWEGTTSRTVTRARLHEVSLVENAAYSGTFAATRGEKKAMKITEKVAHAASLREEYKTANEERQLAILEEVSALDAEIADQKRSFEDAMKSTSAAAAVRSTVPTSGSARIAAPSKDEVREWFRGGFRSNRAIGINIGSGTANLTTNAALPALSGEFIKALDQESVMRRICTVEQRSVDTDVTVISNRMTAALVAEGGAYSNTEFTATKVSFKAYKSAVYTDVSEEALSDSAFDVGANVVAEHGRAHGRLWETYFATGDNSSKPQGIMVASWTTSQTSTTSLTLPTIDDLVTAAYKLNPAYMPNASWLMNQATWANIVKTSASGKYMLNGESGNILRDGAVALLLGKPVYLSEFVSSGVTANNPVALFGDFRRAYRIVDRTSISFTVDDMSQATNGLVRYSSRMRSDGRAVDLAAAVLIKVKA